MSDGRSGSTWFSQLLAHRGDWHVEHEPVHRTFNPWLANEPLIPLPAALEAGFLYQGLISAILGGHHASRGLAPPAQGQRNVIIRDINALMIAPALLELFPILEPVLIVRHPVQVARSKLALAHWEWCKDPADLLADPELRASLSPHRSRLEETNNQFRRYVMVWAIQHLAFVSRVDRRRLRVVLHSAPQAAVERTVAEILGGNADDGPIDSAAFRQAWQKPSLTACPHPRRSALARWWRGHAITRRDLAWAEDVIDELGLRWLSGPPLPG